MGHPGFFPGAHSIRGTYRAQFVLFEALLKSLVIQSRPSKALEGFPKYKYVAPAKTFGPL